MSETESKSGYYHYTMEQWLVMHNDRMREEERRKQAEREDTLRRIGKEDLSPWIRSC